MRRAAILSLLAGLSIVIGARISTPLASPPLFDGVVVQDPYRYLAPGQNQAGSPSSGTSTAEVDGDASPRFAVATTESPPQAQLIAPPGAFVLSAGATSVRASIEPIAATATPLTGTVVGNVYRFSVVDQAGSTLPIEQGTQPTLVLRAPQGFAAATIEQLVGGRWQAVSTLPAGLPGIFVSNVGALGDFALVAAPLETVLGPDPTLLALASTIVGAALVVIAALVVRRSRRQPAAAPPGRRKRQDQHRSGRRHDG